MLYHFFLCSGVFLSLKFNPETHRIDQKGTPPPSQPPHIHKLWDGIQKGKVKIRVPGIRKPLADGQRGHSNSRVTAAPSTPAATQPTAPGLPFGEMTRTTTFSSKPAFRLRPESFWARIWGAGGGGCGQPPTVLRRGLGHLPDCALCWPSRLCAAGRAPRGRTAQRECTLLQGCAGRRRTQAPGQPLQPALPAQESSSLSLALKGSRKLQPHGETNKNGLPEQTSPSSSVFNVMEASLSLSLQLSTME